MSLLIRSSTRTLNSEDKLNPPTRHLTRAEGFKSGLVIGLKPLRWKIVMLIGHGVGTNMANESKTRGV